jgi:hypothetical protein
MAMNKTSDTPQPSNSGEPSPELVPAPDLGSLILADVGYAADASADDLSLGNLLSDVLFGEVIDISDLIPRLSPEAAAPGIGAMEMAAATDPGVADGGDALAAPADTGVLTILYDDDLLASGGVVL